MARAHKQFLHAYQISSAYRPASTIPATIVSNHTCVLALVVCTVPVSSPDVNDVRPGAIHEASLSPGAACEDAEECAGDDTTHGTVWSQLNGIRQQAILVLLLTDALRYAAEESCAQLLQRDDVEEEESGVLTTC